MGEYNRWFDGEKLCWFGPVDRWTWYGVKGHTMVQFGGERGKGGYIGHWLT